MSNTRFEKGCTAWNKGAKGKQVAWNKGKKLSTEHRKKAVRNLKNNTGETFSEETKKKISTSLKGHKIPLETKQKISA